MAGNARSRASAAELAAVGCVFILALSFLPGAAARAASPRPDSPASAAWQPYPAGLTVNEFMPDPASDWNDDGITGDGNDEYIEIYNGNPFAVDLSGWALDDSVGGSNPYVLPAGTVIQPFDVRVFFSVETGVALNNGGDSVRLLYPDATIADQTSYTTTQPDQSYSRTVDGGGTWTTTYPPSPGTPNQPPLPTATPTTTPTPTTGPTATPLPAGLTVNEYMPDPVSDWNGNGIPGDVDDEYIELHNGNEAAVDLSGWKLDDVAGGGSSPFTLPAGSIVPAGGFLLFFSNQTNLALNNSGDSVRLLRPDNSVADQHSYTATQPDQSYSRTVDGGGTWTTTYPPSPGGANQPPATATATATASATSTPTATATGAPSATATASPTSTPSLDGILLNEFMPDPVSDWNGNGSTGDTDDEYIELHNGNDAAVDLSGWKLDDVEGGGSSPFTLPTGSIIPAEGFLLFFSNQTNLALNNGGDSVRLLRPDNSVADQHSYTATQPDQSYSRTVDGGGTWTATYPPSPGGPNQPPSTATATATASATSTPTATATGAPSATGTATATASPTPTSSLDGVLLNEFMPDPASDWNGNGITGDADDEYIELHNSNDAAVDLSGWKLDDTASGGSSPFTLPAGSIVPASGFLLFFSNQTNLALNNGGDSVRLLRPDNSVADQHSYSSSDPDQSFGRTVDGGGTWTATYPPSPGGPNLPAPTPTPVGAGALAGSVFVDGDADGVFEPWLGEQGLGGVLVILDDARSYLTNDSGWYGFFHVAPGTHTVRHAQPVHMASTTATQYMVTVEPGALIEELNFGQTPLPPGQIQPAATLNEFLPSPASDWDGNGVADVNDEWIELYNPGDAPVDVSGWQLDDEADSLQRAPALVPDGSAPYLLPVGSVIPARGFLVVYRSASGVALNNDGDDVRLIGPAGYVVETFSYPSTAHDVSWSKTVDGGDQWTRDYPPSPGVSNQPGPATPTASPTATPTPAGTPTPLPGGVSLNEYLPDPASDWDGNGVIDAEDEYVEIHNANGFAVDLVGWQLDDLAGGGSAPFAFPPGATLPAYGFLVVYRSQTGVALNNDGDQLRLLGPDGSLIEAAEYDASDDDLAYSKLAEGGSLWTDAYPPSPGLPNQPGPTATPTATSTATPTGSPSPTPTATQPPVAGAVLLNEFMPDPASDWDGNGVADANDEYIELYNVSADPVDLGGWALDDEEDSQAGAVYLYAPDGTQPYIIPAGTLIQPGGFLLFYRSTTGVALNNDGDWVRLLLPDGSPAEQFQYTISHDDEAYSKVEDGSALWTTAFPPSPGSSNNAGVTPTPSSTPSTTPTPYPTSVSLNEYLPNPASDWNGDGVASADDEYIELYNAASVPVEVGGWLLDDSEGAAPDLTAPYQIPVGATIPARGFLLFFRSETGVALNNDGGDSVRLLRPDGVEAERHDYIDSAPDRAASKASDGGDQWTTLYPPSPGGPNLPSFTGDERVRVNELLSSPRAVDWDGDGQANYLDEWIELVNLGGQPANLSGWKLTDGQPAGAHGATYVLPPGTQLGPGQFLVVYRRASGIALDAADEWVTLAFPDDQIADRVHISDFAGYDQSWCRLPDGGPWTTACQETPGAANRPGSGGTGGGGSSGEPPYDRFNFDLVSIAHARTLPDDARVTLEGQVTVRPDVLDDKEIYIQDATGGMWVYLRSGEWPPLSDGQWVRVNGWLDTLDGQREIKLTRIDDIKTLAPAPPPAPRPLRTGELNEANEGVLAQISGAAVGFSGSTTFFLDDGSGEARVVVLSHTGLRRPYVDDGELWTVTGIVSQNDDEPPYDDYYRILPRYPEDIVRGRPAVAAGAPRASTASADSLATGNAAWNIAPVFLPVTGEARVLSAPPAGRWAGVLAVLAALLAAAAWTQRKRSAVIDHRNGG